MMSHEPCVSSAAASVRSISAAAAGLLTAALAGAPWVAQAADPRLERLPGVEALPSGTIQISPDPENLLRIEAAHVVCRHRGGPFRHIPCPK